jgi:serine/threonine protein kinase
LIFFFTQVELMQRLGDNEFIISYYDAFNVEPQEEVWISMEFCEIGSVLDLLRVLQNPLKESVCCSIIKDCLFGLKYLHEQGVIHRDFKAGNILLTNSGRGRLTDFGVSSIGDSKKRMTIIGSPYWMAPEVIKEVGYSFPADIWGLGITVIEMVELVPPRSEMHPMKVLLKIPTLPSPTLEEPGKFSVGMAEFLTFCLVKIPDCRHTAAQLLEHSWVQSPQKHVHVAEMVAIGLQTIVTMGGRDEAMKSRDPEEETPVAKVESSSIVLEKKQRKKNANMTIKLVAEDSKVTATEVEKRKRPKKSKEKLELSPEVASCMKKLTRILRSVKSQKLRIENNEKKEEILSELSEIAKKIIGIKDPALESDHCQKALKKLNAELLKVTNLAKEMKDKKPKTLTPRKKGSKSRNSPRVSDKERSSPRKASSPKADRNKEAVDEEMVHFRALLESVHLEQFVQPLSDLGVDRLSDLKFASEADVNDLGMKPIQKKKLFSLVSSSSSASSSSPPKIEVVVDATSSSPATPPKKKGVKKKSVKKRQSASIVAAPSVAPSLTRRDSQGSPVPSRVVPQPPGMARQGSAPAVSRAPDRAVPQPAASLERQKTIEALAQDKETIQAQLARISAEKARIEFERQKLAETQQSPQLGKVKKGKRGSKSTKSAK